MMEKLNSESTSEISRLCNFFKPNTGLTRTLRDNKERPPRTTLSVYSLHMIPVNRLRSHGKTSCMFDGRRSCESCLIILLSNALCKERLPRISRVHSQESWCTFAAYRYIKNCADTANHTPRDIELKLNADTAQKGRHIRYHLIVSKLDVVSTYRIEWTGAGFAVEMMINRGRILQDRTKYTGWNKACRGHSDHFIQPPSNESLRFRFGGRSWIFKTSYLISWRNPYECDKSVATAAAWWK